MPLVTNLNSDDEGLLELVDGQELVRNRSQTKLDVLDVDTDCDDEDYLNIVDSGVPLPTSMSNLGAPPGKRRLSTGAKRRMSMGSVATYGSMPEEYDHVGLDGTHSTVHRPVSVLASGTLKNDGHKSNHRQSEKLICEMDSMPQSTSDQKRISNRNRCSDGGSKSSRDVSVASLGTAPSSYHPRKGPYISNGHGAVPMEDASVESGSILSPYHAGQGPYIKGSLAPVGSSSKKKKRSTRSEKDLCPPTDVMVKKSDVAKERNRRRSSSKKSSRSRKSSRERSRRSRPKAATACIATQTDVSGADIEGMQSQILSQEAELTAIADDEKLRDNGVDEAAHNLDLTEEEEDRTSVLEQEVVELKLQLAQAQADLQEVQLQVHRIAKERDEALSAKEKAEKAGHDLQRILEEIQSDSLRERLKNQIHGTSSRHILQNQSLTSQSAGSSRHGSKNGWHSSITSTGIFGSGGNNRRGSVASSRGSMTSRNNSIGNLSGLFDVQNLSDSDVEEPADTHKRAGDGQKGPLRRDMAQQAILRGRSKATDTLEGGSSSDQEVNDDDPFATVYNKESADEEDVDKRKGGPFGFGLMRS